MAGIDGDLAASLMLYDTFTREKRAFIPQDPDNVRLYVCGPTVYDFAHIGNARPVIVFDILFRFLRRIYGDKRVTYVRNLTDVDDKINQRALETYGAEIASDRLTLNDAIRKVTQSTAAQFHADMADLGCLSPTHEPRATENIEEMKAIIQRLLDRGHAYIATGREGAEVLFHVRSMAKYGALSNRNLDDQQAGARIAVEDHKRDPGDFVLWKQSDSTAPGWEARFKTGDTASEIYGRPGWHIECSAMSHRYLGESFDIHGGGIDLVFPHHENEIAQSCCAFGTEKMANFWMHNGFLQVEGQKMSKSLGNFVTVHELLEEEKIGSRRWPGAVIRLAMLLTHYREPIDFSTKRLLEAENILKKLHRRASEGASSGDIAAVFAALCDDLNSAAALSALNNLSGAPLAEALSFLGLEAKLLSDDVLEEEIAAIVEKRLHLIEAKNWAEADRIRDELLERGVQLKDGKDKATGKRTTTWESVV